MATKIFTYRTYNFVNKDPCIDEARQHYNEIGESDAELADKAGMSAATIANWFRGKTRRPNNATFEAFLRAMGFKRKIVKMVENEYEGGGSSKRPRRKKANGKPN